MAKDKLKKVNPMGHGVFTADKYNPESKLNLEGSHAMTSKAHKVGDKVQLHVTGTKISHRIENGGNHSSCYKIHNVKMMDHDDVAGPNAKGSKNDEDASPSHK